MISKTNNTENKIEPISKGNISLSSTNYTFPKNYTSSELLEYCTSSQAQIYNDVCIRGLWDVSDECHNGNFSSDTKICNDPRLDKFENKVKNEMSDLDRSLARFVDSCMNVQSENDVANCSFNMDRIKADCTDQRYATTMSVCNDQNMNKFNEKFTDILSKLRPEQ